MNFAKDFTEVCSSGMNLKYPSIGSDNGLVPTRPQAIIWANDGWLLMHVCIIQRLSLIELKSI